MGRVGAVAVGQAVRQAPHSGSSSSCCSKQGAAGAGASQSVPVVLAGQVRDSCHLLRHMCLLLQLLMRLLLSRLLLRWLNIRAVLRTIPQVLSHLLSSSSRYRCNSCSNSCSSSSCNNCRNSRSCSRWPTPPLSHLPPISPRFNPQHLHLLQPHMLIQRHHLPHIRQCTTNINNKRMACLPSHSMRRTCRTAPHPRPSNPKAACTCNTAQLSPCLCSSLRLGSPSRIPSQGLMLTRMPLRGLLHLGVMRRGRMIWKA